MRVVAYCAREFRDATRGAAGVEPFTSPPYGERGALEPFPLEQLRDVGLFYVALHGQEWLAEWLGDRGAIAMTADRLAGAPLDGAIVFAESCWMPESPMLEACFEAGARAVVAGNGPNLGGRKHVAGASALGRLFRVVLARTGRPRLALILAKAGAMALPCAPIEDLAEFKLYTRAT